MNSVAIKNTRILNVLHNKFNRRGTEYNYNTISNTLYKGVCIKISFIHIQDV